MVGRCVPARARSPLGRGLPGHCCHDPGLALQVGLAERGLLGASPTRASPDRNSDQKTGDSHGSRESHLGTSAGAGRVGPARPSHRRLDRVADPPVTLVSIPHLAGRVRLGASSSPRRRRPSWPWISCIVDTVFLRRIYALIAVEHGSHRAHLAGVTAYPTGAWTPQAARNLLRDIADRATRVTFLLRDRDCRFTSAFDTVFTADGIRILISPPGAPRANAICEHMIENPTPRAARQGPGRQRTPPAPDPHDLSAPLR